MSEADKLLRELWSSSLQDDWEIEQELGECFFPCRYHDNNYVHDQDCLYNRIKNYIGWTPEQQAASEELHEFYQEVQAKFACPDCGCVGFHMKECTNVQ